MRKWSISNIARFAPFAVGFGRNCTQEIFQQNDTPANCEHKLLLKDSDKPVGNVFGLIVLEIVGKVEKSTECTRIYTFVATKWMTMKTAAIMALIIWYKWQFYLHWWLFLGLFYRKRYLSCVLCAFYCQKYEFLTDCRRIVGVERPRSLSTQLFSGNFIV